jgi:hypothetical protein
VALKLVEAILWEEEEEEEAFISETALENKTKAKILLFIVQNSTLMRTYLHINRPVIITLKNVSFHTHTQGQKSHISLTLCCETILIQSNCTNNCDNFNLQNLQWETAATRKLFAFFVHATEMHSKVHS